MDLRLNLQVVKYRMKQYLEPYSENSEMELVRQMDGQMDGWSLKVTIRAMQSRTLFSMGFIKCILSSGALWYVS